jgi:hypothetical protein
MTAQRKSSPSVVKVKPHTHAKLLAFSKEDERPMSEIVEQLVDRFEKERFWAGVNEDLARLKADPVAWQGYLDEMAEWDNMPNEVLDAEEPYYTPEEEREILAEAAANRSSRG